MQEFRRLDSQLGAARDRAELLAGGADTLPLLSVQVQSGTGALLRERATLNSSTNYVSVVQMPAAGPVNTCKLLGNG
jgi:hypothetical protein